MSDDGDKRDDVASTTIPPGLRPFMGVTKFPKVQRRGEDPELDAAFAALEEMRAQPDDEPQVIDPTRGVGNASEYVAGVELPTGKAVGAPAGEQKVELAIVDIGRALPAGNPAAPTEEINTRALREHLGGKAPGKATGRPPGTVGGNTERLRVVGAPEPSEGDAPKHAKAKDDAKPASPWTKDAPPSDAAVRASALPASLRPRDRPAPSGEKPAATSRGASSNSKLVITAAIVLVALAVAVLVITKRTPESGSQGPVPTATPTATTANPTALQVPPFAPAPSSVPVVSASANSAATAPAVPSSTAAAPEPQRPAPRPSSTAYDPYADAAVTPIPAVTAPVPIAPPAVPRATAVPVPDGDGEIYNRHNKTKSP